MTIIIFILLTIVSIAILFPPTHRTLIPSDKSVERSNAKQIATSVAVYQADYDGKFPPMASSVTVGTALYPYLPGHGVSVMNSNTDLRVKAESYKWNHELSGVIGKDLKDPSIWLFYNPKSFDGKVYLAHADSQIGLASPLELKLATAERFALKSQQDK